MKNVGILVYDTSLVGGAEKVAINLAKELSTNVNIHLISLFNEKKKETQTKVDYKFHIINKETVSITKNVFMLSKKLKKYLIKNNIDILFSITAGVNGIAIIATRNTDIKTVYCEHSNLENRTYGKKHRFRQFLGAKKMDMVVTLTQRDKYNFIKMFKVPERKIRVITNWFEYTKINNKTYNEQSKKIITAGRLEKVKGHDLLIQVAKIVKEKHNDWIWEIYGDGKYKEEIEKNIVENGLGDFIILKGNVNNLKELYNDYAFFVLTSYYEGIPLVLLEAQNAKLPIISFDSPTGPSEIIKDNINGFLIPTYNIELMANKINELIEDKNKRKQFSDNSQIDINKFDKKDIIKKWIKLIEEI